MSFYFHPLRDVYKRQVKEQALEYGHSEKREFAFLITHSMLHLFGYDHMEADEACCCLLYTS